MEVVGSLELLAGTSSDSVLAHQLSSVLSENFELPLGVHWIDGGKLVLGREVRLTDLNCDD